MIELTATDNESGVRLDRVVRKKLPLMALSAIYGLIRRGGVRVNGRRVRQDCRLASGDRILIDADPAELAAPRHDGAPLTNLVNTEFFRKNFRILHEDHDLIACDKPAGLVVHGGTGHLRHDTLLDLAASYLLKKSVIVSSEEIALVHRLDRDTSGVILIAKNKAALRRLHESFRDRTVDKQYIAVCHHRPPENEGKISLRLSRGRDQRGETTMLVDDRGNWSNTRYRVDLADNDLSRLEIRLDTGKTHQIRVHLSHLGCPIVGDERYGDSALDDTFFPRSRDLPRRLYLHSHRIRLPAGSGRRPLAITAPLPREFKRVIG